jgi:hypothetical protein
VKLRNFISSLLAGLGATTVHIALMSIKHRAGILPDFEPYEDLQRLLSSMTTLSLDAPFSWLLPLINGAVILGFVFGRLFVHLPGRTAIAKGAVFGFAAWLVMGLGLLPLAGRGVFAHELGHGGWPAALMLVMLMMYAIVMSLLYAWLSSSPRGDERARVPERR